MLSTVPTPRPSKLPLPRTANKHYKQFTWAMLPVNEWFLVTWMFVCGPRKESKADICMQSFGWYLWEETVGSEMMSAFLDWPSHAAYRSDLSLNFILTRETIYIHAYLCTYLPAWHNECLSLPPLATGHALLPLLVPLCFFILVRRWLIHHSKPQLWWKRRFHVAFSAC